MTAAHTRGRWSLVIAVILHALLFLILALSVLPQLDGGSGGKGVGLEVMDGNADYDDALALPPPTLPQPPELSALPQPETVTADEAAVVKIPTTAATPSHMQLQAGGAPGGDEFLARVRAHLAHYRQALPADLRTTRGTTLLRFTVAVDGVADDVSIATSSGNAALDQQALALLQRAQPLPHKDAAVTLIVPVEFGASAINPAE